VFITTPEESIDRDLRTALIHEARFLEWMELHTKVGAVLTGKTLPVLICSKLQTQIVEKTLQVTVLADFVDFPVKDAVILQCPVQFKRPKHERNTLD
jgi:hypothetical protein